MPSVYRQILWSSAVLASARHHTKFVLDALSHVKPMKIGRRIEAASDMHGQTDHSGCRIQHSLKFVGDRL